ncbi:MAG: reverse transcriptase-like protein [Lachnospiraceae bacterium]|nr:reverse transcriptase-like protein [Lachnospiraceae bacterium]
MDKRLTAFVDGSFEPSLGKYAYGCVILEPDGNEITLSGAGNDPEVANIRNVAGEMLGAMNAVKWARAHGYTELEICYDYMGIEMWATGGWKAKNKYTQGYADYMRKAGGQVKLSYRKIAAHTGDKYNEMADKLAKGALIAGD